MEPIMHFLIPLLILLVVCPRTDKKLAIGLAFIALAPDLDFFIDFTHRYLFHSVLFPIILSLIIYLFSNSVKISLISFYYLMSHLMLDLTTGAVAFFWPFYQRLIEIKISLSTWWQFDFRINTYPLTKIKDHMESYPSYFFTQEGVLIALFILFVVLIIHRKKLLRIIHKIR